MLEIKKNISYAEREDWGWGLGVKELQWKDWYDNAMLHIEIT